MSYQILTGDVLEQLATLADESVQCCVTSPPYWGLRDYGVEGQLGLEKVPEEYVEKMVEVFGEVWRVLRDDGTLWLNIGDSYAGGGGYAPDAPSNQRRARGESWGALNPSKQERRSARKGTGNVPGLKPKDLCLIPERLAIALQAAGWWVRSRIAWCKKSCMPESVTDRPTGAWEHIWLLTKAKTYYYDAEAVRQSPADYTRKGGTAAWTADSGHTNGIGSSSFHQMSESGANLRNVWHLGPEPFPDAHFATFPTEIPRRAILAGTSAKGCCPECGAPWEREVERSGGRDWHNDRMVAKGIAGELDGGGGNKKGQSKEHLGTSTSTTAGWRPTCDHDGEPVPCTVLDPFAGAMTTGVVAEELGRNSILIELNPEYAAMGDKRIQAGLPVTQRRSDEDLSTFRLEPTG